MAVGLPQAWVEGQGIMVGMETLAGPAVNMVVGTVAEAAAGARKQPAAMQAATPEPGAAAVVVLCLPTAARRAALVNGALSL